MARNSFRSALKRPFSEYKLLKALLALHYSTQDDLGDRPDQSRISNLGLRKGSNESVHLS